MKWCLIAAAVPFIGSSLAEDIPQERVLEMELEGLAEVLGDRSEAGEDRAARIFATAKRVETENRLAKQGVARVVRLDDWRGAIERWQDLQLETRAREAGGGTMWGHLAARDDVELERFLAAHADELSKAPKTPVDPATLDLLGPAQARLDAAEDLIKELEMPAFDRKDLDQRLEIAQSMLSFLIGSVDSAETRTAVTQWITALSAGDPAGGTGFSETLELQGITFEVSWDSEDQELVVAPQGLELPDQTWRQQVAGTVTGAEVADLDANGFPEVYIYLRGDDDKATLHAFAVNRGKSMTPIHLREPAADSKELAGYGGGDEFAVVETTLVRRFPLMKDGAATGKTRQFQYKLKPGEAAWQLVLDRVVEY